MAGIWLSAGFLANEMGEPWASLALFEEALRLDPNLLPAVESARRICVNAGLLDKARFYSEQAYRQRPSDDIRIAQALTLSAIQLSAESVRAGRAAYELGLDAAYAYASEVMTRNMLARDAEEGIDAFLGKRPPVWEGR